MRKKIITFLLTILTLICAFAFTACDKNATTNDSANEDTSVNAYKATFDVDENVSVYFYDSQDYSKTPTAGTYAYSTDADSGEYLKDGTGQVNFKLVFDEGFVLDDVIITGEYGNLKLPDEVGTDGVYRITKIAGDISVNVVSKEENAVEDTSSAYEVQFNLPEHVSIVIYERQYLAEINTDETGITESAVGYARRDSTGKLLTDGNGQINFKLICDEGFEVDAISVEGTYKNIKTPSDTKVLDLYRITKIESALTVSVTVTESTEEDYTDAYTVTFSGEHFTVYVYKTQDVSGDGEQTSLGYARNSTTGKLDNSGSGQINFKVVPDEGYEITSVTADQNYNKLNTYENNVYRITKISGNVAVTIVCIESAN